MEAESLGKKPAGECDRFRGNANRFPANRWIDFVLVTWFRVIWLVPGRDSGCPERRATEILVERPSYGITDVYAGTWSDACIARINEIEGKREVSFELK